MKNGLILLLWLSALTANGQSGFGSGSRFDYFNRHRLSSRSPLLEAYEMELSILEKQAIRRRKKLPVNEPGELAGWLISIQTNAFFLKRRWQEWYEQNPAYAGGTPNVILDDYLRSITRSNELLTKAANEKPDRQLELVRDVALDLQIKADNCRNSKDGLGKIIRVQIRTKHDTQEVPGYEVWYVQKGYYDVPSAHERFHQQSSPTDSLSLWPGRYAIWVRKDDFTGKPATIRIGGQGQKEIVVDLEVP